jgi:predicted short-subunit dehydrogenase-like oxidoreductase (DUF2520 family)
MSEAMAIAGAGRMGQALGRLLRERGESVMAIAGRNPERTAAAVAFVGGGAQSVSYRELPQHASRLLIAVPDDAIGDVALTLAEAGMHSAAALHTCGARGPEALDSLRAAGVSCGTLHPLQTVANPEEGIRVLPGVAFAVDGDPEAVAWAGQIVSLLNGQVLHIPPVSRALYHAAAVMSSNYLIALISSAVMLMGEAGVDEEIARRALLPLARTSVRNACELGPAAALTGPIARGDIETVRGHLSALARAPAVESLYRSAGLVTLELGRRRGLGESQAGIMEGLLRKGEQVG